jgi:class 3 adenylate cyclase
MAAWILARVKAERYLEGNVLQVEASMAKKTVVELDLVAYSDVARTLEENLGAELVGAFNTQIQGFVDIGLAAVNVERRDAVRATTGDGAIVAFNRPEDAFRFAVAVHEATRDHNANKSTASAQRWFRIGIATGDLYEREKREGVQEIAGIVIANAVRLETSARPGQIVLDDATFAALGSDLQGRAGDEEKIPGKRQEVFVGRRVTVLPYSVAVLLKLTSPTVVDQTPIREAFEHFGVNWPPVKIAWPESADQLRDILRHALEKFDKGAAALEDASHFGAKVPGVLAEITKDRQLAEATVPAMVKRLRKLNDDDRIDCVRSFLLYANLQIHATANYYASWSGLSSLGLEVPSAWVALRGGNQLAVALGKPEEPLVLALLNRVADFDIYDNAGGEGLYVFVPKRFAPKIVTRPYELPRSELYRWVIPQLEYALHAAGRLPDTYSERLYFSKLGLSDRENLERDLLDDAFGKSSKKS